MTMKRKQRSRAEYLAQIKREKGPRDRRVHALRNQGWTLEAIGDHLGISKQRVAQVLGGQ